MATKLDTSQVDGDDYIDSLSFSREEAIPGTSTHAEILASIVSEPKYYLEVFQDICKYLNDRNAWNDNGYFIDEDYQLLQTANFINVQGEVNENIKQLGTDTSAEKVMNHITVLFQSILDVVSSNETTLLPYKRLVEEGHIHLGVKETIGTELKLLIKLGLVKVDNTNLTYGDFIGGTLYFNAAKKDPLLRNLSNKIQETERKLRALSQVSNQSIRNILYVEGISDKAILEAAWNKLRPGKEIPFDIECGENTNAESVADNFKVFNPNKGYKICCLLDADEEGYKQINKVNGYNETTTSIIEFNERGDNYQKFTISKSDGSKLMLLPVPYSKRKFLKSLGRGVYDNEYIPCFTIEHYFSEKLIRKNFELEPHHYLKQRASTIRPALLKKIENQKLNVKDIEATAKDKDGHRSKTRFANDVVSNLPKKSFNLFEELILEIEDTFK